jgi:DsbC/DsbD-like thiol-disulfide interchange protein
MLSVLMKPLSLLPVIAVLLMTAYVSSVQGTPTGNETPAETPVYPHPGDEDNLVTASLLTEAPAIRTGGTLLTGIRLEMEEGWYVYWKNPGDSGIPTTVRWSLPAGYAMGDLLWPTPGQFYTDSFVSYGYKDEVILFAELAAPAHAQPGTDFELSAQVVWLVCKDVCIPGSAEVSTVVRISEHQPEAEPSVREVFDRHRKNLPVPVPGMQAEVREEGSGIIIDLHNENLREAEISALTFYCEQEGVVESGADQHFETTGSGLRISLQKSTFLNSEVREISGVLYNANGWGGNGMKGIQVTARVAGPR